EARWILEVVARIKKGALQLAEPLSAAEFESASRLSDST
ncbi:MAG: hypothetical protein RJB66_1895, partial [Pseudomonadota bacterium]